jgi:hypothetical protein
MAPKAIEGSGRHVRPEEINQMLITGRSSAATATNCARSGRTVGPRPSTLGNPG